MALGRRAFLLGLMATGVAAPVLSSTSWAQAKPKVRVQIGWVPNVQYAGEWVALDRGFMNEQGIDVEWYPGGPNALPAPVVLAAGKADLGYSTWFPFLDAIKQGNDLVMIAAVFPRSPLGIISLAKKPLRKAQDLVGAKILAQGQNEKTAINATLSLAGLPVNWTQVPAGFSPEPLLAGDGDGYTAFSTNQTITLERMGLKWDKDFFFAGFEELGFKSYSALLVTTRAYLAAHRKETVSYVRGLIKGWDANEKANPEYGAKLATTKYGADLGLDLAQQTRMNELQMPYTHYADGNRPRLALDRDYITGPLFTAARATGRTDLPDVDKIADFGIVAEAHAGL